MSPKKRRKKTVPQNDSPCSSCGTNCITNCNKCTNCEQWVHDECSGFKQGDDLTGFQCPKCPTPANSGLTQIFETMSITSQVTNAQNTAYLQRSLPTYDEINTDVTWQGHSISFDLIDNTYDKLMRLPSNLFTKPSFRTMWKMVCRRTHKMDFGVCDW